MAATTRNHRWSGGKLVKSPSNLADPANLCGGTQLGTIQNVRIKIQDRLEPLVDEARGGESYDQLFLPPEVIVECDGTGWDKDLVASFFSGSTAGAGSTPFFEIGADDYGALISDLGLELDLLWIPNDDANNPALRAYRAVPYQVKKPVYFSGRKPAVLTLSFLCMRSSAGKIIASDLLASGNL